MEEKRENYQPQLDDLISLQEAAKLSGLSHDHFQRLAGQGNLWEKKKGRNWVIPSR